MCASFLVSYIPHTIHQCFEKQSSVYIVYLACRAVPCFVFVDIALRQYDLQTRTGGWLTGPATAAPRHCDFREKTCLQATRKATLHTCLDAGALCALCLPGVAWNLFFLGSSLRQYDFRAARVALVPSVPGTGKKQHKGRDLHKYGHMRVRALLSKEIKEGATANLKEGGHKIVLQFSSLASLSSNPVRE